jgi:hypothetical protein
VSHTEQQEPVIVSQGTQPPIERPPVEPYTKDKKNEGVERYKDKRYKVVSGLVIALLLIIIAVETVIILEQRRVTQQIEARTEQAYGRFLKQGQSASGKLGSDILLRNVQYCWSQEVCIHTDQLTATAVPVDSDRPIVFDDLTRFIVQVHNGRVRISPRTLQGMFNESVFNYPGSNLRNLTVNIQKAGQENRIKLAGSLKYFLWIPFEMDTNLSVNQTTNTLVISVYKLTVFGFIPATWLIQLKPFNLDKLLTLPENRYLTVHRNLMMVKPFGLFPPPRIDGKMADITVLPSLIQLSFIGNEPRMASSGSSHSILLKGGNAQFGRIQLLDANVVVNDQNPGNDFRFSLLGYLDYLPRSHVKLEPDGSIVLDMPDHGTIPDVGKNIPHPKNDAQLSKKKGISDDATVRGEHPNQPSVWVRAKTKLKQWLKI